MGIKKFISKKARRDIYDRDNMICCYCDKLCLPYSVDNWKNSPLDVATLDHIVSQWEIAQASESDAEFRREIANPARIVVVCNGCNSSKKHTPLYIWCSKKGFDYNVIISRIADRVNRSVL